MHCLFCSESISKRLLSVFRKYLVRDCSLEDILLYWRVSTIVGSGRAGSKIKLSMYRKFC